jgi:hypothetical protein
MRVEWRIGVEMEMKEINEKYSNLFWATTIFIKFLHRDYLNFTYIIISDQIGDLAIYN